MGLREMAVVASLAGCAEPIVVDYDKPSTTPDCENAGVNATVTADLAEGTPDDELLTSYGVTQAIRAQLTLAEEDLYITGSIEDTQGNAAPFNCLSNEAGNCEVDIYGACPDIAQFWNVELNSNIQGVTCSWVLPEGSSAPEFNPECDFDPRVSNFFSVDATGND